DIGEPSTLFIDPESTDRARGALGGVQEAAVRGEVKIRSPDIVVGVARGLVRADRTPRQAGTKLRIRRQHGDGVAFGEEAGALVERESRHGAGEFAQQIDEAVVLRDDQVARSRALLQLQDRRRVGGEASALLIEQELENLVGAEMRDKDKAVR